jgi:hypothetical protein
LLLIGTWQSLSVSTLFHLFLSDILMICVTHVKLIIPFCIQFSFVLYSYISRKLSIVCIKTVLQNYLELRELLFQLGLKMSPFDYFYHVINHTLSCYFKVRKRNDVLTQNAHKVHVPWLPSYRRGILFSWEIYHAKKIIVKNCKVNYSILSFTVYTKKCIVTNSCQFLFITYS